MCEDGSSMAIMLDHKSTAGFIGKRLLKDQVLKPFLVLPLINLFLFFGGPV